MIVFSDGINNLKSLLAPIWGILFLCTNLSFAAKDSLPIARIKESVISCPSEIVHLDGWASIVPKSEIELWIWDITGDGVADTSSRCGDLEFKAPGRSTSFKIVLWVKDKLGRQSLPDSVVFHVMDGAPSASVGRDTTVPAGTRINFTPSVIDNCSKPIHFEWDFNDDGKPDFFSKNTGNTFRVYNKPGKYYARFSVKDELGREAGGLRIITVK